MAPFTGGTGAPCLAEEWSYVAGGTTSEGAPCSWRATAGVSLAVRASATAGNGVLQRLGLGGVAVAASGARGASAYIEQRRGRKEDA